MEVTLPIIFKVKVITISLPFFRHFVFFEPCLSYCSLILDKNGFYGPVSKTLSSSVTGSRDVD